MSGGDKQLELEALAAVGEMLLFDQARGNPEEAARILRCARLFARSEDAAQRLSELCNEAGSDRDVRQTPSFRAGKDSADAAGVLYGG
ncbi:MAG: hypothetical protein VB137_00250 [Burkholderia sp.]